MTRRDKREREVEQATFPRLPRVSATGRADPDLIDSAVALAAMSRSGQAGMSMVVPSVRSPSAVATWPPDKAYSEASTALDWAD